MCRGNLAREAHVYKGECPSRGDGTGGAGGAIAPPIVLEIGRILAFSTPNISELKEGATWKIH